MFLPNVPNVLRNHIIGSDLQLNVHGVSRKNLKVDRASKIILLRDQDHVDLNVSLNDYTRS